MITPKAHPSLKRSRHSICYWSPNFDGSICSEYLSKPSSVLLKLVEFIMISSIRSLTLVVLTQHAGLFLMRRQSRFSTVRSATRQVYIKLIQITLIVLCLQFYTLQMMMNRRNGLQVTRFSYQSSIRFISSYGCPGYTSIRFPARKDGQNHFAPFGHNGQPFCDVTGSQYDQYPTSSGSSFMLRSCGFEPVPNPRTQVLMIEHLFATRLEVSKVIA